jgi:hypothetical protein
VDPHRAVRADGLSAAASPVADGVWRLTRGFPLKINVFLVREDDAWPSSTREQGHGPAARAGAAELAPATAWPAHFGPLTADVAAQLRAI